MLFTLLSIFVILCPSEQSHFRGGSITAVPVSHTSANVTMKFTITFSWRLSTGTNYFCNQTTISSNGLIGPAFEYIYCKYEGINYCSYSLASCDTYCIAFSSDIVGSDWSYGKKAFTIEIPQVKYYEAAYGNVGWMKLNGGGSEGAWEVRIRLDTTVRRDTGVINSTPITTIPPIVKFRSGIKVTIPITWADADESDDVRCRWAESVLGECGGVCQESPIPAYNQYYTNMSQAVPPATLNGTSCMLDFDGSHPMTVSPGYYAVALQIEDFVSTTASTPLSSIPIQFLIELVNSPSSCSIPCFFTGDRSASGCYAVNVGEKFTDRLVAEVGCSFEKITEIQVLGLSGNVQVSSLRYIQSTLRWYVNLTWVPTSSQQGANVLCGMATDSAYYVAFHCYTIIVGISQPVALNIQPSGILSNTVLQGANNKIEWKIEFNQKIALAVEKAYVSIFHSNGTIFTRVDTSDASLTQVNNFTLSFWSTNSISDGTYYGTLDYGVARGILYCKPSSLPETNSSFWTFTVTRGSTTQASSTSTTTINSFLSNNSSSMSQYSTVGFISVSEVSKNEETTTKKTDSANVGIIAGGVAGGVAALAAGAGLILFLIKRLKNRKVNSSGFENMIAESPEYQTPTKPTKTRMLGGNVQSKNFNLKPKSLSKQIKGSEMTPVEEAIPFPEIKPVKTKMMGPLIKNKNFNLPLEDALKEMIANSK